MKSYQEIKESMLILTLFSALHFNLWHYLVQFSALSYLFIHLVSHIGYVLYILKTCQSAASPLPLVTNMIWTYTCQIWTYQDIASPVFQISHKSNPPSSITSLFSASERKITSFYQATRLSASQHTKTGTRDTISRLNK